MMDVQKGYPRETHMKTTVLVFAENKIWNRLKQFLMNILPTQLNGPTKLFSRLE